MANSRTERVADGTISPNHSVRSSISMHTTARGREFRAESPSQGAAGAFEEEDDEETDALRSISVGREEGVNGTAWDESDEEQENEEGGEEGHTDSEDEGAPLALSSGGHQERRRIVRPVRGTSGENEAERGGGRARADSYLQTLKPSSTRTKRYWKWLTHSSPAHASLSAPHVSSNLFAASLHPAVLLSMPYYFERTGIAAGVGGLVVVAILGGAGGGLWVVLSRYVKGSTVEAITGASFGRHTRWKGSLGRAFSGILLAVYATGAAVIAYFALADLLLQVLFHYFPSGSALHDRALVTLLIGGLLTTPLVVFPLAKRTLIRLSTFFAVSLYPVILAIALSKVYTLAPDDSHTPHDKPNLDPHDEIPSFNPLHDPSVWAPYSLLPLLTLSSSPLQILAHNRSLRRRGLSGSNVKAFLAAQAAQVFFVVGFSVAFGIGVGTQGIKDRMGVDIHREFLVLVSHGS
ncbi:AMINO ACID TRANSPORTER [Ceraceosorus bombacis]|uniref:AMINO ACID TRANSPORTER n=1 Tax=Ceraceosorus bombacis TaxID=401625 RepID=A0A0P1BR70_9BASI|nr:AMINO ACID TRANSPORTER [Ceraceosorus bombacis]